LLLSTLLGQRLGANQRNSMTLPRHGHHQVLAEAACAARFERSAASGKGEGFSSL
jgi:hypothetical protein